MRPYALAATGLLLAWLLLRPLLGRRFTPLLASLLVVGLLVGGAAEWRWRTMEARYTTLVRDVLGRDTVSVHCQRLAPALLDVSGFDGRVPYDVDGAHPERAFLSWRTCRRLAAWERAGGVGATVDQARAVHVLSHEIMHLSGEMNEARAECAAMQRDSALAQALGATRTDADALAAAYWTKIYPDTREEYRDPACAAGQGWDEHPQTVAWPAG